MNKSVERLGIYRGRVDGFMWVHCPMRKDDSTGNDTNRAHICRACDSFEGVERQDSSNPFNDERVVLCSYEKGEN